MKIPTQTTQKLEHVFTPYLLIVVNMLIIFLAEIVGQGKTFYDLGLIHGIAIVFILLAAYRTFQPYYVFDPELRKLLRVSLFAQAFFALSHFVEFASFEIFHTYTDAAFANVANIYIISLLFMFIGAEYVLTSHDKRPKQMIRAASVAIAIFLGLTALFLNKNSLISLEADEIAPYAYGVLLLIIGITSILRLRKVSSLYPLLKSFAGYLSFATALIIFAALPNVFYEILEGLGMDQYQIIYLSHFTFYGALSVMFLAYGDSLKIGGIHKDVRQAVERGEVELN